MNFLFRAEMDEVLTLLDTVPGKQKELFEGVDNLAGLELRLEIGMEQASTVQEKLCIGVATNRTKFELHLGGGLEDDARRLAVHYAECETPIRLITAYLSYLGTSYGELCVQEETLLMPAELDEAVLRLYASKTKPEGRAYLDAQAVAVIEQTGADNYDIQVIMDNSTYTRVNQDRSAIQMVLVNERPGLCVLSYEGSEEGLSRHIAETLEEKGKTSHVEIMSETKNIIGYISTRYFIHKIGSSIRRIAPEAVSPIGNHIGLIRMGQNPQ